MRKLTRQVVELLTMMWKEKSLQLLGNLRCITNVHEVVKGEFSRRGGGEEDISRAVETSMIFIYHIFGRHLTTHCHFSPLGGNSQTCSAALILALALRLFLSKF